MQHQAYIQSSILNVNIFFNLNMYIYIYTCIYLSLNIYIYAADTYGMFLYVHHVCVEHVPLHRHREPIFSWLVGQGKNPVLKNDGLRQLGWLDNPNISGGNNKKMATKPPTSHFPVSANGRIIATQLIWENKIDGNQSPPTSQPVELWDSEVIPESFEMLCQPGRSSFLFATKRI